MPPSRTVMPSKRHPLSGDASSSLTMLTKARTRSMQLAWTASCARGSRRVPWQVPICRHHGGEFAEELPRKWRVFSVGLSSTLSDP
jgi:hypothetical protein